MSRSTTVVSVSLVMLIACASGASHPPSATATASGLTAVDAGIEDDGGDGEGDASPDDNAVAAGASRDEPAGPCPSDMVLVVSDNVRVCVDRWEASVVEVDADGNEKPYPHWLPVDGHAVRAVSQPDVFPQGYISEVQAEDACAASHKRLCAETEWMTACVGPEKTTFPYGDARRPTACHDSGRSAVGAVFGQQALASSPVSVSSGKKGNRPVHSTEKKAASTTKVRATKKPAAATNTKKKGKPPAAAKASGRPSGVDLSVWKQLNDPRLGQVEGALARTGSHEDCTNGYGALDMMGNLHEWVRTPATAPRGTFAGGYYLDTTLNGDGCKYRTKAHAHDYHDYSTGFRCCADPK